MRPWGSIFNPIAGSGRSSSEPVSGEGRDTVGNPFLASVAPCLWFTLPNAIRWRQCPGREEVSTSESRHECRKHLGFARPSAIMGGDAGQVGAGRQLIQWPKKKSNAALQEKPFFGDFTDGRVHRWRGPLQRNVDDSLLSLRERNPTRLVFFGFGVGQLEINRAGICSSRGKWATSHRFTLVRCRERLPAICQKSIARR